MNAYLFRKIYEENEEKLYRYTFLLCKDEDAAVELMDETFLVVLKNLDKFSEYEHLFAAMKKTATHIQSAKQKKKEHENISFAEFYNIYAQPEATIEKLLIDKQESAAVNAALRKLSDANRNIILLHYFHELSFPQIADTTGVNYTTVLYRHKNALQELRYILTGEYGEEVFYSVWKKPRSKFYMFLLYILYLLRALR